MKKADLKELCKEMFFKGVINQKSCNKPEVQLLGAKLLDLHKKGEWLLSIPGRINNLPVFKHFVEDARKVLDDFQHNNNNNNKEEQLLQYAYYDLPLLDRPDVCSSCGSDIEIMSEDEAGNMYFDCKACRSAWMVRPGSLKKEVIL